MTQRSQGVRARAPLRLGLGGGGTDLASYYDAHGGGVLNATIDRYAYAHLAPGEGDHLVFIADDLQAEERLPLALDFDIREGLRLHRAVYRRMMRDFNGGRPAAWRVTTTIDVPQGSGLGASSALVVAMIQAFALALDVALGPYEIAQLAYDIERDDLALMGGKQDQYAAAFGGVNFTEFLPGRAGVIVNPLRLRPDVLKEFESSLVICFSGQSRLSSDIIEAQVRGLDDMDAATLESMHAIKRHAVQMKSQLVAGHIRDMARALHESWLAKKATARQVSSSSVETLLTVALNAGAWAGKVSGAGGGGFIMLLVDPSRRYGLIRALNAAGGDASAVKLTFEGVEAWWAPA